MFNPTSPEVWPPASIQSRAHGETPLGTGSGTITNRLAHVLPIAAGANAIIVSLVIAWRIPTLPFMLWAAIEQGLGLAAVVLFLVASRKAPVPAGLSAAHALGSAASIGFGLLISLASHDWAICTLASLSAVALVGNGCLRHYSAPRLVAAMVTLGLGIPCLLAALFAGEPILLVVALQVPLYAMTVAAAILQLGRTMVRAVSAEQENDRRAHHDTLTGLLNRAGLARELGRRSARGERFALVYLDLDRFKSFNDSFGHEAGDELLKVVADRIRDTCRAADAIARIGGDEFVVLTSTRDADAAKAKAEMLVGTISDEGFFFRKEAAIVGARAGIALCPDHGGELGPLLGEADAALCQAKFAERERCVVARTGIQRNPVSDRRPVSLAVAQQRMMRSVAA